MASISRFILKDQPNALQRKSYKSEKRYLIPNPLIICTRESISDPPTTTTTHPHSSKSSSSSSSNTNGLPRIVEGTVSVELVDGNGKPLHASKQKIFESSDGSFEQALDSKLTAEFSLKVLENSTVEAYGLLFTIQYTTVTGERLTEQILSRKFVVQSNKALKARERPTVLGIKPSRSVCDREADVWIKGSEFHRQGIVVCFGERMGKVLEIAENLLVVSVPVRPDLTEETDVVVTVSNKYRNEVKQAEKRLKYTYLPPGAAASLSGGSSPSQSSSSPSQGEEENSTTNPNNNTSTSSSSLTRQQRSSPSPSIQSSSSSSSESLHHQQQQQQPTPSQDREEEQDQQHQHHPQSDDSPVTSPEESIVKSME